MDKEIKLIDLNLNWICKSSTQLSRADFIDLNKKRLSMVQNKELQLTMIDENLINDIGEDAKFIRLTSFGKKVISEYGGWIKYLKKQEFKSKTNLKSTYNDLRGANIGMLNQDSHLEKSPIDIKVKAEPNSNPPTKSSLQKFFSNPYIIGSILLIIEEIAIGIFRNIIF